MSEANARPKYSPGTLVWVWVEATTVWWPAEVIPSSESDMTAWCLGENVDCCVRLLNHGENGVFPVSSRDKSSVRRLKWSEANSDEKFQQPAVTEALKAASELSRQNRRLALHRAPPPVSDNRTHKHHKRDQAVTDTREDHREEGVEQGGMAAAASCDAAVVYTEEELVKIDSYLAALDGDAAAALRRELGLSDRRSTTTARRIQATTISPSVAAAAPASGPAKSTCADAPRRPSSSLTLPAHRAPVAVAAPVAEQVASVELETVTLLDAESLEVLRLEVFDNRDRCVLDPIYTLQAVLGAVGVPASGSFRAEMPTRHFVYNSPHRRNDRVLLVAVGSDYDPNLGWFEAVEWEGAGGVLKAEISINRKVVPTPPNWRLTASHQADSKRTLVPMDITDVIECTLPEEEAFELRVHFSTVVPDVQLWDAILVCILVEEKGVADVCAEIEGVYHSPTATDRRSADKGKSRRPLPKAQANNDGPRIEVQHVSARCPLTAVTLRVPCRGALCEHMQCMELEAVVHHCLHRHVWNCPMCSQPMLPSMIVVDHILRDVLDNIRDKDAIEAIVFNEKSYHYTPKLKSVVRKAAETVIDD